MRLLVTNDDGIASPGIHALARTLAEADHEVVVVAPQEDMSGIGAAIGRVRPDQRITIVWRDAAGSSHRATVTLASGPAD